MSEIFGYSIDSLTAYAIMLLISESLTLLFFYRDNAGWRFRPTKSLIKTWKVTVFIFGLFIFTFFFGDNMSALIQNTMKDFQYRELLMPASLLLTFVWIWHYVVGKDIHKPMILMLIATGVLIAIFVWINIELIQALIS
ncbi:hypothetical protein [Candidatus Nitrosotenuis cloacae]|uniref:Uncharacterized protein n=1 Tax=Candidatus Nitrosotenuis cloacae TaxID=1603555 RepID=A0A3G1B553_9ARCH|nr:hypothetical protein [Candidatus Nitrosotenuis cloacae]AJZ76119.1 hypothetical protein SU86_006770 [Candidatus Nitrosotenuis cloacae]